MKIAIYWEDLLHYHVARISAAQALARSEGSAVIAYTLRPASPELPREGYHHLLADGVTVLTPDSGLAGVHSPASACALVERLNDDDPDAVAIVGYDNRVALMALDWCRRRKRGAILMTESQRGDFRRSAVKEWLKRRISGCFDATLVGGRAHIAYAHDLGFASSQIFPGYDAVDNDFWANWSLRVRQEEDLWRSKLQLPARFFLTAGRLVPKKNMAGLIGAYYRYANTSIDEPWPLVIAGDGELAGDLRDLVGKLGLDQQIRFAGYLSAEELAPFYALASAFVLASAYAEQWGLVVNEAMAAGKPVLVSNICGCAPDLVVHGVTGFSFDPADEAELAHLLLQCASGQFDLAAMGRSAQDHIALFSPQVFARNLLDAAARAAAHANHRPVTSLDRLYARAAATLTG